MANPGYHELVDPHTSYEVRLAEFRGLFTAKGNNAGMFDLTFNCKPQRFFRFALFETKVFSLQLY